MIRQLGGGGGAQKRPKSEKTGSKERHKPEFLADDEIDPADFFDPEEFGFRRRGVNHAQRKMTTNAISRTDVLRVVKRRVQDAGLPSSTCCHTFRAAGITGHLENGGTIENAQAIAAHESPRTTKLYDRTGDEIALDEVERIGI